MMLCQNMKFTILGTAFILLWSSLSTSQSNATTSKKGDPVVIVLPSVRAVTKALTITNDHCEKIEDKEFGPFGWYCEITGSLLKNKIEWEIGRGIYRGNDASPLPLKKSDITIHDISSEKQVARSGNQLYVVYKYTIKTKEVEGHGIIAVCELPAYIDLKSCKTEIKSGHALYRCERK